MRGPKRLWVRHVYSHGLEGEAAIVWHADCGSYLGSHGLRLEEIYLMASLGECQGCAHTAEPTAAHDAAELRELGHERCGENRAQIAS